MNILRNGDEDASNINEVCFCTWESKQEGLISSQSSKNDANSEC